MTEINKSSISGLNILPITQRWCRQKYPAPSVAAIICTQMESFSKLTPQYLLIKRQVEPFAGKWALISGVWEFGETLETAIKREVKEETGLDVKYKTLLAVVNNRIISSDLNIKSGHFIIFVCELSIVSGSAKEQSEGPISWFSQDDLQELLINDQVIKNDYEMLSHFARNTNEFNFVETDLSISGNKTGTKK